MSLKSSTKIIILTTILTICIRISTLFLGTYSENSPELDSAKSKEVYGNIGVAISTNIGTRFKERNELPVRSFDSVIEISDILGKEETINDELLKTNMLFMQDYLNLMKTDVNELLQNGSDKKSALDALISQLTLRYKNASKNLATTLKQIEYLKQKMQTIDSQVSALKTRINQDFQNADSIATIEDKNEYLTLKAEWTEARTYIIYFNKFVGQYNFLNNRNLVILDTLTNNRDIITKNSYVVLPDSGTAVLKDLNLIIDEKDFKANQANTQSK